MSAETKADRYKIEKVGDILGIIDIREAILTDNESCLTAQKIVDLLNKYDKTLTEQYKLAKKLNTEINEFMHKMQNHSL